MVEESAPYDSVLFVSFGGPEGPDDVMPFLRNVVRGRGVPDERLAEVAKHYQHFDGKSPINEQNRALIEALQEEFSSNGIELPIYFGNRNWHPFLAEAIGDMQRDGCKRALAFVTSAFSSYSGCRQYLENIEAARNDVGESAPIVDKLRVFYNHPGFVAAVSDHVAEALSKIPEERRAAARIAFTAHSIPASMSDGCEYTTQLEEACRLVAQEVQHDRWQLVYQSRSGPPQIPWLEPDILDHLDAISQIGISDVVVAPIGFVSDHVEVIWDLDNEAAERAMELGINLVRAQTASIHPEFVSMIRELVQERIGTVEQRRALGSLGPSHDSCAPDCCTYERRSRPPAEDQQG